MFVCRVGVDREVYVVMIICMLLLVDIYVLKCVKWLLDVVLCVVDDVDFVVYVGDWVDEVMFVLFEVRVVVLYGVFGNNDGEGFCVCLLEVVCFMVEDFEVVVVYEIGFFLCCEVWMDEEYFGIDLLVFGYLYIFWDILVFLGMWLLNFGLLMDC